MESLNLYYNINIIRELIKDDKDVTWIGLPLKEINMDFYLEDENINLYQEIILRLFNCGYNDKKSIEDVLKFNSISEIDDTEDLIDYILKELETFEYIKDDKITEKGKDILKDIELSGNYKKQIGSIFYNVISDNYINYIARPVIIENDEIIDKRKISKEDMKHSLNFGSTGYPLKLKINFIEKNIDNKTNNFTIENFVKIISEELINLKKIEDNTTIKEKTKNKRQFLNDVRKFIVNDSKLSYMLVGIKSNGEVINPFYPESIDYSLKADLEKIPELKSKFKENIKILHDIGKTQKVKVKEDISEKEKNIIEDSGGKLQEIPELVKNLSILFIDDNKDKNEDQLSKYKENIPIIYNCFCEIFKYLLNEYTKNSSYKKERNIELAIKNILKLNYNLEEELIQFYTLKVNPNISEFVTRSQKLIDLFIYTIFLENKYDKEKLEKYLTNNPSFFSFIEILIRERNRFSHSGENQEYEDDLLEYDFESESKKRLIEFVEAIFEIKFENSLNTKTLDNELIKQIRRQSEKEISIDFGGTDIFEVFEELVNSKEYFIYYKNFKNEIYKAQFIKSIGILLESIMKVLRNRIDEKQLTLSEELKNNNLKLIKINDIESKFLNKTLNYKILNKLFDSMKDTVSVSKKKIVQTSLYFKRGTLNTYALSLLFSEGNFIKEIREKEPEFFKLVFVVSNLRSHNGSFVLKTIENTEEEVEYVSEFLEEIYAIVKKILIKIEE